MEFVKGYLEDGFQVVNLTNVLDEWRKIFPWVIQGSILGSLLVNIFYKDVCCFFEEIFMCGYADGNSLYSV